MIGIGYKQSQENHTLFFKHLAVGKLTVLIVYIDDIIMISDDNEEIPKLKTRLVK